MEAGEELSRRGAEALAAERGWGEEEEEEDLRRSARRGGEAQAAESGAR
jgi:hypothetical protein